MAIVRARNERGSTRLVVDALVLGAIALVALSWIHDRRGRLPGALDREYFISNTTALALDGGEIQFARWSSKVLLVNFWAPWCGPCRTEVPELVALQANYSEHLVIVGVAVDSITDAVREFAGEHGINYPMLMSDDETLRGFPPVGALPTSFLVQRDGRIHRGYRGIPDFASLRRDIERLIAQF
jgi:thiol-disulfide isomerase/thioredoxin